LNNLQLLVIYSAVFIGCTWYLVKIEAPIFSIIGIVKVPGGPIFLLRYISGMNIFFLIFYVFFLKIDKKNIVKKRRNVLTTFFFLFLESFYVPILIDLKNKLCEIQGAYTSLGIFQPRNVVEYTKGRLRSLRDEKN